MILGAAHASSFTAERKEQDRAMAEAQHGLNGSTRLYRRLRRKRNAIVEQPEAALDTCLTELRSCSGYILGDPLMAMAFRDKPSRDLLCGFHGMVRKGSEDNSVEGDDSALASVDNDIPHFDEEANMILLLYQCNMPRWQW